MTFALDMFQILNPREKRKLYGSVSFLKIFNYSTLQQYCEAQNMDLYAVWLDMNVYLLIVVAFKGHLGMNSLFGITESSFWLAKVALQENIRNTKVELIRWVVPVQKGYEYETKH